LRPVEATASIDPRIRARRIEVQRHAGRRRLRRVVDVGLVLLVAAGFAGALRSPLLDVEEVRVAGGPHTPAVDVLARAGIEPGQQLVDLDLEGVGEQVAVLPWVDEVTVHRRLGGAVDIVVTERVASAIVGAGPEAVLVDREGRALVRAEDAPDLAYGLVRVQGLPEGVPPGAFLPSEHQEALALAGELAAAVPGAIGEVVVGEDLRATLVQGGQVRFGDSARLSAKLRSLATVLAQVDLACLGELDLRSPASPVLTRREACS
jgi:cell division protein FtsQ